MLMNIETLREFCLQLPHATEDVKWGKDLCFCIAEKMFCVTGLEGKFEFSVKTTPQKFEELIQLPGVEPAPYVARYKWVLINEDFATSDEAIKNLIEASYNLIKSKIPKSKLR
jgi:predicted DNA-binding protein (MmcQ/YjbR family)